MSINPELDDDIQDIRDKLGPDSIQEKMVMYLWSLGHEQNYYLPAYFFKECAGKKATQRDVTIAMEWLVENTDLFYGRAEYIGCDSDDIGYDTYKSCQTKLGAPDMCLYLIATPKLERIIAYKGTVPAPDVYEVAAIRLLQDRGYIVSKNNTTVTVS